MKYTPIVGTLGYVLNPEKTHVLMVHRIAREHDAHFGKYNGVGGKLERDEEIVQGMKRELLEETGLTAQKLILRGTVNWTNFGPKNEDWLGFIFIIESFSGTPFESNAEGKLEWVPLNKINDLPMWEGDRFFLPLLFDHDPRVFHGYMPYDGNQPKSFSFSRI
jgi:8-oxo-dGTP diphosphatase